MSEFKFSCPHCGQHLACDETYAGLSITCPSCQQTVVIPVASPAAGAPVLAAQAPPLPGIAACSPAPAAATRTSRLAVAALALSCAGLIFGFLTTIPGIICGIKAGSQIRRTPGLGGKGLATAGLVVGCLLTLLWIPLACIITVGAIGGFRAVERQSAFNAENRRVEAEFKPDPTAGFDTTPDGAGWTLDLGAISIPDAPLTGRLRGRTFNPKTIALDKNGNLEFSYNNSDRVTNPRDEESLSLELRFNEQDVEHYSKRTFLVRTDGTVAIQPQGIWAAKMPSLLLFGQMPGKQLFTTSGTDPKYAMRLEFGELKNGKLPGRIYLCVLDTQKSYIRGTFVATVETSPFANSPGPFGGSAKPAPDLAADTAGWTLELAGVTIPDAPATGRIHGQAFKMDQAQMQMGVMLDQTGKQVGGSFALHLREGGEFFADREFNITFTTKGFASLSGQTIRWPASDPNAYRPTVLLHWKVPGKHFPENGWIDKFAMRIEFGELKGGELPGRVYLSLLDTEKSFVRGSFVAKVLNNSGSSKPPRSR